MAKFDGKDMAFKFGSFTVPAGYLVSVDWPEQQDEIDVTGATQDDKEFLPSERSSTVTLNMWADAAMTIADAFKTTLGSQTGDFWEQGNTTGKPKKSASMFVTSRSKPIVHNQGTAMTVTLRITGTITESTVS